MLRKLLREILRDRRIGESVKLDEPYHDPHEAHESAGQKLRLRKMLQHLTETS